jgi:hypothetical protein
VTAATNTATATDTFVVPTNHAHVRRLMIMQGVVAALILVLGGARALTADGWGRVAAIVLYAIWLGTVVWSLVVWRRIQRTDVLARIGPTGIGVQAFGRRGWVETPWEAITSVRKDIWGRVVVKPAQGKRLLILVQPSHVAVNQVLAAVTHFSGGRL